MIRHAALALCLLGLTPPAFAQTDDPQALVASLHAIFGQHHARAAHAKGIILEGRFTPTADAARLSTAAIFKGAPVPLIVRFSDGTGLPDIADTSGQASPRGMAIRFAPKDGDGLDLVVHSFNGFPTATAAEFGTLLHAIAASGPTAPKPTPLDTFLATHPAAKTFLTAQRPPPASFATTPYFGVNAIRLVGQAGRTTTARFRLVPEAGEHYLGPAEIAAKPANYLMQDIAARVAKQPVRFDLLAQIAAPGDDPKNPALAWPETRAFAKLGTVAVTRVAADQDAQSKALVTLPGNLPPGITAADPMLDIRSAAYTVSGSERQ